MEISRLLDDLRQASSGQAWEGTLQEFLAMALYQPHMARTAHARVHDMIQWHGLTGGAHGAPSYKLFADRLFGLDRTLDRLAVFFQAASSRPEMGKRILLLVGPPASGKSAIVGLIKQGLERYTPSPQGATYAIKGCPMQEDPLHLIPHDQRARLTTNYGLRIDGELCPRCRHSLAQEYGGDITRVMVQRLHFNQSLGVGMGSFVADPQQDLARLMGSVDETALGNHRREGGGEASRLDGELQAANRVIMEFPEIFQQDQRNLAVLLGVSQERTIKLGGFGSVHADEVIIGHSNEEEYQEFLSRKGTRALRDRLVVIEVPYCLQVQQEVKMYQVLLTSSQTAGVHLAPLSLPTAATLAVLSRLEPGRWLGSPNRVPLRDKLALYQGVVLPPYIRSDVERLQQDRPREGMHGISPRHVVNGLADALARESQCLRPLSVLQAMAPIMGEHPSLSTRVRRRLPWLIKETLNEYQAMAMLEVRRAVLEDFHQQAWELFQTYVHEAERYSAGPAAEDEEPPDLRLMAKVEWAVNIKEEDRPDFRDRVLQAYRDLQDRGEQPDYRSIPGLAQAIEATLLPSLSDVSAALGLGVGADDGAQTRQDVEARLINEFGYCAICARDLLDLASNILQGRATVAVKRGRLHFR